MKTRVYSVRDGMIQKNQQLL